MDSILTTLDLEELTPKQMRKILSGLARAQQPFGKKTKEEQDEDAKEAEKKNDSLVDLDREKGDSKPPKVKSDDLPGKKGTEEDDDEEDA
jgi:hypothetical protein